MSILCFYYCAAFFLLKLEQSVKAHTGPPTQSLWLPLHRQRQVYRAFRYDNFAGLRVSSRKTRYIDKRRCKDDRQPHGSAFMTEDRLLPHALPCLPQNTNFSARELSNAAALASCSLCSGEQYRESHFSSRKQL